MVAALYVERGGVYYDLPDVDPWDEERDARLYAGPWPVVAHPPCAAWSSYSAVREACYGKAQGEDGGCFAAGLEAVRRFGGVLEHPANSKAWAAFGLPRPTDRSAWSQTFDGEWVGELDQAAYGLRFNKATWLYYAGHAPPIPLRFARPPKGLGPDGVWSYERSRTPPTMRDYLLDLAREAPSRLAKEGRALPYMGRRRSGQETNAAG